jgi:hypothetical protein
MPYFNSNEGIYYCPVHRSWYKPSGLRCLVVHAPGTCCHEYEKPCGAPIQAKGEPAMWLQRPVIGDHR